MGSIGRMFAGESLALVTFAADRTAGEVAVAATLPKAATNQGHGTAALGGLAGMAAASVTKKGKNGD